MSRVRIKRSEEQARKLAERQWAALKAQRDRHGPAVLFETLRDELAKAQPRKGKAGGRDVLGLYYSEWVTSRARTLVYTARKELFGKEDPPFLKWSDAQKWLVSEADLTFDEVMEIIEKARDAHRALGLPEDSLSPLSLTYSPPGKPDKEDIVYFTPGSRLALLHNRAKLVMEVTGWTEEAVIAHVLVGAHVLQNWPEVVRVSLSLPDSRGVRYVDVRMWPWDIPASLRDHLGRRPLLRDLVENSGPAIHPLDAHLLLLMELEGYPPRSWGEGTDYWKRLALAWKKTYSQRARPDTLRKRWERMQDKGDLPNSLRQGITAKT